MADTQQKPKAPVVSFDVCCQDCGCDVMLPLVKMTAVKSFSGNKIQIEWPSRENADDFARVACPQCGTVMVVQGDTTMVKSPNKLFAGKPFGKKKKV